MRVTVRNLVIGLLCLAPLLSAAAADVPKCLPRDSSDSIEFVAAKAKLSQKELLARLVYAEALSTGIGDDPLIHEAIAWGVMNRVRLAERSESMKKSYGSGIRGVVFKKGQFNPAVSSKSTFSKDFLCPKERAIWRLSLEAAGKAMAGDKNPFIQTPWEQENNLSLVVNFYYPKSIQAKGPYPPWEGGGGLEFAFALMMVFVLLLSSTAVLAGSGFEASAPGSPTGPEPVVTITSPAANSYNNTGSVTAKWTVAPNQTAEFAHIWNYTKITKIGGADGTWINKTTWGNHTFSGLTDGQYIITVVAVYWNNTAVAYQNGTKTVLFTVDLVKPTLAITNPVDGSRTNLTNFTASWTVDGTGTTVTLVRGFMKNVTDNFVYSACVRCGLFGLHFQPAFPVDAT